MDVTYIYVKEMLVVRFSDSESVYVIGLRLRSEFASRYVPRQKHWTKS